MSEDKIKIKELEERLKLIENFYEENSLVKRIKFHINYYKERLKYANYRNNTKNDTSRNNTIYDNNTRNTRDNEINKIFNG